MHVDVAIIGAGTAGMGAYRAARAHTDFVLLIEGRHYGTTCARFGCMPSKLLIAAAQGQSIQARRIVTATGSIPVLPPLLQGLSAHLLTNETVFELPSLPKSLAVFGAGVLGMELAQAMSRLGVHVKTFGVGGGIAAIRDLAIRDYANQTFNEEFYLDASAQVRSVKETSAGVEVEYLHRDGAWHTELFDYVLAATGRAPDVKGLALTNTGLALNERGVPSFDRLTQQCGNSTIFIAGDASNEIPLLHEAADQGRITGLTGTRNEVSKECAMPAFGSPFSGLTNDRKLTNEELVRAIRFMVAAEYEATQLYLQLAESTDNKLAVKVLREVADEELVHAGEFLRLLHELAPDEEKLYAKGAKEVAAIIKKMN